MCIIIVIIFSILVNSGRIMYLRLFTSVSKNNKLLSIHTLSVVHLFEEKKNTTKTVVVQTVGHNIWNQGKGFIVNDASLNDF